MVRIILLTFFILCYTKITATHIVGGEFELEHLTDYTYELRMILYFDQYYGSPAAEDQSVTATIFRKRDNAREGQFVLANMGSEFVEYTNPICTIDSLSTRRILYKRTIVLSAEQYNDPEGYYVVWERCCRNNAIDNIFFPGETGQTFYLEFPPVVKDGKQFINSTPNLFPPLSDFACLGREFYADFTGVDKDGDSLVYSLTEPWAGNTTPTEYLASPPKPAPYRGVNWVPGVDKDNMIPGNPSLFLTKDGILKVSAKFEGLFVFAVKCEEFRDGVKIGEVRRDFQMLVIECHEPGSPPSALMQVEDRSKAKSDTLKIVPGQPGCFKIFVSDPDVSENITVRAVPVNFSGRLGNLFSELNGTIVNGDSPLEFDYCLPACPIVNQRYAIIDVITMDDECSVPLTDTVRLVIDYGDLVNTAPYFTFTNDTINYVIKDFEVFNVIIEGRDNENMKMTLEMVAQNFDLSEYEINLTETVNEDGRLVHSFSFDTDCNKNNFDENSEFQLVFYLKDKDTCNFNLTTRLVMNIKVDLPGNNPPVIIVGQNIHDYHIKIGEPFAIPVLVEDEDNDQITLTAQGIGFDLDNFGMNFEQKQGVGRVSSNFIWNPDCDINIDQKNEFQVKLTAQDHNQCLTKITNATLNITVEPPSNQKPLFSNQINQTNNVLVGETLELNIFAADGDGDFIYLDLLNKSALEEAYSIEFEPKSSVATVASIFRYIGDCGHLGEGYAATDIDLTFVVYDQKCFNPKGDTMVVRINVSDVLSNTEEFLPPNVFSPNNDEHNQYFTMPNLPNNNCYSEFMNIQIYNRWGKRVFISNDRGFAWDGDNYPTGVYFYVINFSKNKYKGHVSILR